MIHGVNHTTTLDWIGQRTKIGQYRAEDIFLDTTYNKPLWTQKTSKIRFAKSLPYYLFTTSRDFCLLFMRGNMLLYTFRSDSL